MNTEARRIGRRVSSPMRIPRPPLYPATILLHPSPAAV
jgi:hypothetical protein